ncbi:MAG: hypothetical protein JWN44_802 [Myxococcales bacterium]|nr:hypothetical protein [Myxococcales bacterium]
MSAAALAFVARHGVVLQSAHHPTIPSLAAHVAGERIKGSWWAHPKSHDIFAALVELSGSPDVVSTRLVDGKVTLVHRRLWAALATLAHAGRIDRARMARVTQEHTASGRHEKHEEPFPAWLPRGLERPGVEEAISLLGEPLAGSLLRPADAAPRSRSSAGRAARARRR